MHSALAVICYIFVSCVSANTIRDTIRQLENEGHDLSHIDQANLRRVISQNIDREPFAGANLYTNNDTNSNGSENATPQRCNSCAIREEQKKRRIEVIKKKISHALNLDLANMPNATGIKLPKVPSFLRLMERYEIESIPQRRRQEYEDEEDEFGQPERTYTYAKIVPANLDIAEIPNVSFFPIPPMVGKMPYKALLWVYIKPSDAIPLNTTEINLYSLEPPGRTGGPPIKRFLTRRGRNFDNVVGWHHFNILSEVLRWSADPRNNYGIVVEAIGTNGNLVVLPPALGIDEEYIPMLDIRTTLRVTRRSKRSAVSLNCDDNNQYEACCRYPLVVDFVEFGWDFVIAPNRYHAYYCAGECQSEHLDANDHAHIVQQTNVNKPMAGPCCTPTRMSNLPMLYWDENQSVQFTTLPKMRVERCGCA